MGIVVTEEERGFSREAALLEELKRCVYRAGEELYLCDSYLIANENAHVSERSIVFRFGLYLERYLSGSRRLKPYQLDCEYNRNLDEPKYIPGHPHGSAPDLILHRRGTNLDNLLVIECKGYWADPRSLEEDRYKLRSFMEPPYRYSLGLLVRFERTSLALEWFRSDPSEERPG